MSLKITNLRLQPQLPGANEIKKFICILLGRAGAPASLTANISRIHSTCIGLNIPSLTLFLPNVLPELDPRLSGLVWTAMFVSLAIVITLPRQSGIRTLIASTILRLIFSVGLEPTLSLLGTLNVSCLPFKWAYMEAYFWWSQINRTFNFILWWSKINQTFNFILHVIYLSCMCTVIVINTMDSFETRDQLWPG